MGPTELGTASLETTGLKQGSQLCCLGRFGGERRRGEMIKDSPHSRSDRLLQAQVWRGFVSRFQMKSGGRHSWLGKLKEIQSTLLPLDPGELTNNTRLDSVRAMRAVSCVSKTYHQVIQHNYGKSENHSFFSKHII